MRLILILSNLEPTDISPPSACPYTGCGGRRFRFHQAVEKPLRDGRGVEVQAHRYECLRCGRTFRVYPKGVSKAHTSLRVKNLGTLLYLLGLSYGAVSRVLDSLGVYMSKSQVYDAVRQISLEETALKRRHVFAGSMSGMPDSGQGAIKVYGRWRPLELELDDATGLMLSIGDLSAQDAEVLQKWMAPIAESVGAQIVVVEATYERVTIGAYG